MGVYKGMSKQGGNDMMAKERMIKVFIEHGMSQTDFNDFYKEYGIKSHYSHKDVRNFLGY